MITVTVKGTEIDILPVINGLVSESTRVKECVSGYDAVGISLGPEDVEALRHRKEIEEEYEPSDLEAVYAHYLSKFGKIDLPPPAFSAAIDAADALGIALIPLDMGNEEFSEIYCDVMSLIDVLKSNGLAKKAVKKKFDMSSPEAFVDEWDVFVNTVKGNRTMSSIREHEIAERILSASNDFNRILAVVEQERVPGILEILKA